MKSDELAATRRRLIHVGVTRLLPVGLLAAVLLYGTVAYLGHLTERRRNHDLERVIQRGESSVASRAVGYTMVAASHTQDADQAIVELREHYGIDGNDIPSYTWRGNELFICANAIAPGECSTEKGHAFALAYAYHLDLTAGLDTWNVVFAPVRRGHFTRDRARIVYRINTSGSKVAVLMASADFGEGALPEPIVGQLNDFSDSVIGQRLEASANEEDAEILNPLGLQPAEMRLERFPSNPPLPGHDQIAVLVDGPLTDFGEWIWADGNATESLGRILQLLAVLGVIAAILRAVFAFATLAGRWSLEVVELLLATKASGSPPDRPSS